MTRAGRNILIVLLPVVVLFLAGTIGERLGSWTDAQRGYASTLTWVVADAVLLAMGIAIIWFLRRRRQ
jgi:membrane protein DedA with SNARE-associated domain